jgi:hypothetical protein
MVTELDCFLAGFAGGGIAASLLVSLFFTHLIAQYSQYRRNKDDFMLKSDVIKLSRDMQAVKIQLAALNAEVYKPFDLDND